MLCDFWSHWADVIALANPLDSAHKISQQNWNCSRLWQRLMISAEGKILPCSFDVTEEFCLGHFPEVTIQQAWLGNKMKRIREAHVPNQDNCLQCSQARRKLLAGWQSAHAIA
jgi:radical SAM protein with 4Fe4S-binding SPASM domain